MFCKNIMAILANNHGISKKKATDHYDYLVHSRHLPYLKAEGKVVVTQATTTKCTAITTEKLLWNHTMWEVARGEVKALNGNDTDFENV